MTQAGWCGATLVVGALACLVASEIIGTAHASRDDDKRYTFAVSSGSRLVLQSRGAPLGSEASGQATVDVLDCRRVVLVGDVRFGYGCRRS